MLLIHALLVLPFLLELSPPTPRRPNSAGPGASALVSSNEPDMTVVFVDEPSPIQNPPPRAPSVLASRGITPPDLPLVVLSPDPSLSGADAKAHDSDDTAKDTALADAAEHARLYGRYIGQVQARIERAWLRPRTGIGAPTFSCRTRIQQDRRGTVVEVTVDHCNGTDRWQQSLLSAIRTASPLPAPPDESVYADVLWLSFSSQGYEESGSTQGFEPELRVANNTEHTVLESFQRFASGTRGDQKSDENVIHLTIIGPSSHDVSPTKNALLDPLPHPLPEPAFLDLPPQ